jgi:hypothetical protein
VIVVGGIPWSRLPSAIPSASAWKRWEANRLENGGCASRSRWAATERWATLASVVNDGRLLTGGVWGAILGVVTGYLLWTVLKRLAPKSPVSPHA